MTTVAVKGLLGRKLRAALTALAIVLGVAMVSGSFVLTDSIQKAFHNVFASAYRHTDAVISGKRLVSSSTSGAAAVPASLLQRVRALPDVADAAGILSDMSGGVLNANLYDKHGKVVRGNNPSFGVGIDPSAARFNPMNLVAGRWASRPGEVVVDNDFARKYGFRVGDETKVSVDAGVVAVRVVGIARYGGLDSLGGATFAIFDLPWAQKLFHLPGRYLQIAVAAKKGVPPARLVDELRAVTPADAQVRTGAAQAAKDEKDVAGFVKFIRWFLVGFGLVALFVGSFVIFNTLSITVAQRTRELATLRTLGASRRQVLVSVVLEALLIGMLAAVAGLGAGIGLAKGLSALFGSLGLSLPEAGLPIATRTIVVPLLMGTVLTVVAGLVPAVRATRVPAISAVREGAAAAQARGGRTGPTVATVLGSVAAVLLGYGFFAHGVATGMRVLVLVGGFLTMFVALAAIFSRLVRPFVRVLGVPFARLGRASGKLAAFNVARNPGRTAATAAALMIGIALVSFVALFGRALRNADEQAWKSQVTADYVVSTSNHNPFAPSEADAAAHVPGVRLISHVRGDEGRVDSADAGIDGVDPTTIGRVVHLQIDGAPLRSLHGDEAIVKDRFARAHHIHVGTTFTFRGPDGRATRFTAVGVFRSPKLDSLFGSLVVPLATFDRTLPRPRDVYAFVDVAGGVSAGATKALAAVYGRDQILKAETRDGFAASQSSWLATMLNLIYVLLALSVVVSLFGIVNTLALAVFERTREIGMLRAVGMTRRQARRMIRHEAMITSLLGAALGLPVGIGLAALAAGGLSSYGLTLTVPVPSLVTFVVVSLIVGVVAAVLPARRAGKLDVLAALSYE
ncbi:MAG TPA: FtsX-like permease family protein [Gaiellaceae bacterium]|nr:FtsX-like permease family protein [Gaiellaceae bacterium]